MQMLRKFCQQLSRLDVSDVNLNAIGVIEINYFTNGVVVLDRMLKAADVYLASCHKILGGRMMHIVITGLTSDVQAAIDAAKKAETIVGKDNIKVAIVISNPHQEIIKQMNLIDKHLSNS